MPPASRTPGPRRRWRTATAALTWLLLAAGAAAATSTATSIATATEPALGAGAGASRQAWAAAAALSRGIGLGTDFDAAHATPDALRFCATAARADFRSVHLPVRLPPPPARRAGKARGDDAMLQRLDAVVDGCLAEGLGVVLDLRPPLPAAPGAGRGPGPWAQRWQQLATRYAGRPQRLLFQLSFTPGASPRARQAQLATGLRAVRHADRQRVVVVGWDDAIGLLQLKLPAADRHLIVGLRNDEPLRFTHQGAPGLMPDAAHWRGSGCCSPQERQLLTLPLDLALRWSQEHRYPVWLRDFRSHRDAPADARVRHARLVREAAEARGLPWCYGDFAGAFGAYDANAGRWNRPLLDALTGP